MKIPARAFPLICATLFIASIFTPTMQAVGPDQNDAGSGGDAGDDFASATPVPRSGRFHGELSRFGGDPVDFYKFPVSLGESVSIDVEANLFTGSIQVSDADRRIGLRLWDPNGVLVDTPNTNVGDSRVSIVKAVVPGDYRLEFDTMRLRIGEYSFCFVESTTSCQDFTYQPIGLGTPLPYPHANVLLLPPTNGNPLGSETSLDYLDATLRGIRKWGPVFEAFAADYPQFSFLKDLTVHVEVFDGETPQRAGYDVIIMWLPYTGPQFRGLAVTTFGAGNGYNQMCGNGPTADCATYRSTIEPLIHDSTRLIFMSLFGNAPRAGQTLPDWPERNDVENVAMHEFAHTWGLGHSATFTHAHGPDLMNSPYTDVFGDGDPAGDGGERTKLYCISSLDVYGMARLYDWLPSGDYRRPNSGWAWLPWYMPYKLYC